MVNANSIRNEQEVLATPHIKGIMTQLLKLDAKIADEVKELDRLKGHVKDFMGSNGVLIDEHGVQLAAYKEHRQRRLNTKKLRSELPDVYEKYSEESKFRPFKYK